MIWHWPKYDPRGKAWMTQEIDIDFSRIKMANCIAVSVPVWLRCHLGFGWTRLDRSIYLSFGSHYTASARVPHMRVALRLWPLGIACKWCWNRRREWRFPRRYEFGFLFRYQVAQLVAGGIGIAYRPRSRPKSPEGR